MDYTVNDYLSDFKYYLKYLKTNSSSCWKLDVEKEYNKYKDEGRQRKQKTANLFYSVGCFQGLDFRISNGFPF